MPFIYAALAAAMGCEVEIHFVGRSVRLLVSGVAESVPVAEAPHPTLYGHMREAFEQGARFVGCSLALKQYLKADEAKIPEFSGAAGAATVIMRTLDPEWRILQF